MISSGGTASSNSNALTRVNTSALNLEEEDSMSVKGKVRGFSDKEGCSLHKAEAISYASSRTTKEAKEISPYSGNSRSCFWGALPTFRPEFLCIFTPDFFLSVQNVNWDQNSITSPNSVNLRQYGRDAGSRWEDQLNGIVNFPIDVDVRLVQGDEVVLHGLSDSVGHRRMYTERLPKYGIQVGQGHQFVHRG